MCAALGSDDIVRSRANFFLEPKHDVRRQWDTALPPPVHVTSDLTSESHRHRSVYSYRTSEFSRTDS